MSSYLQCFIATKFALLRAYHRDQLSLMHGFTPTQFALVCASLVQFLFRCSRFTSTQLALLRALGSAHIHFSSGFTPTQFALVRAFDGFK